MRAQLSIFAAVVALSTVTAVTQPAGREPGLLFYLSGDRGLTADYAAGGSREPTFVNDVRIVPDGARGAGIECGDTQLLAYRAPGNIYAQRGTLSFFWRSRDPVGKTAFPVFRVGYAEHSSWDMVWLRVDYNGGPGFDAFVTDTSLARTRVSVPLTPFPRPKEWVHLTLTWDETKGIRFYVNGRLAAEQQTTARYDAALDQFGPHSRTIGPMQVQSAYNFVRGGDIDELRIYDRMIADDQIAALAHDDSGPAASTAARTFASADWRDEWWYRYGWNRAGDPPPALDAPAVAIRKLGILDAYDLKRWWWKANDGIRETTWPGVFNRSRLPGRNDYFQLPDWDVYSEGGKSVTFTLPDEPWNQVEISGAAWGAMSNGAGTVFQRPKGQERTVHRLAIAQRGGALTFTNVEQETPIGELSVFNVTSGSEPAGVGRLTYRLTAGAEPIYPDARSLLEFIDGRNPADERATMFALPAGAPRVPRKASPATSLPIVHIVVPSDFRDVNIDGRRADFSYTWMNMAGGLDGVALDLPAFNVKPTHGDVIPLNVQVKDPLWPLRDMIDVSFSVRAGERHTLWLDLRDRILPNGKPLYLTIASASPEFSAASLEGAELRLVFKPWKDAAAEHVADRFAQVRDNYAQIIEERPNNRRLALYTRFEADLTDLLRVAPDHALGRQYWYDANKEQPRPAVAFKASPPGVPLWAARQIECLGYVKRFVNWYIDHRQVGNGEFGGGLSDDGDLTNDWPGTAFMGATPGKIRESLLREMEAFYAEGMFTNGLSTIQTDELHSYEEGIQVLGQALLLDYGGAKHLERAMETAAATERITGINAAGHRHIRSSYFSGTTIAEEGVWGWSKPSSYLMLHPSIALVDFNGSPRVRKWLLELADSLLAHRKPDASGTLAVRATVEFASDADLPAPSERAWPLLWAAYRWTGEQKYLQPMLDAGPRALPLIPSDALSLLDLKEKWGRGLIAAPQGEAGLHFAWQLTGDTKYLERLYEEQIAASAVREYINTEGSLWIDRVTVPNTEIQRARLGGIALVRNSIYPGHVVSWTFEHAGDDERVAILVREATPRHIRIVAHNLTDAPVKARMTTWDVTPGEWKIVQDGRERTADAERSGDLDITFRGGETTIAMDLVKEGVPYRSRPDLGIAAGDVRVAGRDISVTVHSLGAVAAPRSTVVVRTRDGRVVARTAVGALPPPVDLRPKTATVHCTVPAGVDVSAGTVSVELPQNREITLQNNQVTLPPSP